MSDSSGATLILRVLIFLVYRSIGFETQIAVISKAVRHDLNFDGFLKHMHTQLHWEWKEEGEIEHLIILLARSIAKLENAMNPPIWQTWDIHCDMHMYT